MNWILSIIIFLTSYTVNAQITYSWINMQYDAGDMSEYPMEEYFQLNGPVKQVHEVVKNTNNDGSYAITETSYLYLFGSRINQIKRLQPDSSEAIYDYHYSAAGSFQYQVFTYIFNAGSYRDTIRRDTINMMYEIPVSDSIKTDENDNAIYYQNGGNETYAIFDEFGRKVQDSIPATGDTMEHLITYKYGKKKIVRKEHYPKQDLLTKTTYTIDDQGNWVKCIIVSNHKQRNAIIKREIEYY